MCAASSTNIRGEVISGLNFILSTFKSIFAPDNSLGLS
nr:MAG TPA: hypothetical protein [Caudoviricetes sp.]